MELMSLLFASDELKAFQITVLVLALFGCNLGTGDFNNDLCLTDCPGDVWTLSFTGRSVRVVAPTGPEYGRMRIRIDGRDCGEADLHAAVRSPQQTVFSARLRGRRHTIEMICTGGLAAIDALVIR